MARPPQVGESVNVKYNPKNHKVQIEFEEDVRYDLNILVKVQREAKQKRQQGVIVIAGAKPTLRFHHALWVSIFAGREVLPLLEKGAIFPKILQQLFNIKHSLMHYNRGHQIECQNFAVQCA
jgi:hypothetical protein